MNLTEYGKTEITNLIEEWVVGRNAKRDRDILLARFIDGATYERIADALDVSVDWLLGRSNGKGDE